MVKFFKMEIGQFITFDLETWHDESDNITMVEHKAKILSICNDPMKIHESKCCVEVNGEKYGIPFSEVKNVFPATGEQLEMFNK